MDKINSQGTKEAHRAAFRSKGVPKDPTDAGNEEMKENQTVAWWLCLDVVVSCC